MTQKAPDSQNKSRLELRLTLASLKHTHTAPTALLKRASTKLLSLTTHKMGKIICGVSNLASNKVTCAAMKISNYAVTTSICDVNKADKLPFFHN